MGGSAKKAVKKVTSKAEEAVAAAINPVGYLTGTVTSQVTGEKALKTFANPLGETAGEVGEYTVDKPKAAREAQKQADQQAEALRQRTKRELEQGRRQSAAESEAADALNRRRAAQARRRKGTGRSSTILTQNLGGVGGEGNQGRKTLLGL